MYSGFPGEGVTALSSFTPGIVPATRRIPNVWAAVKNRSDELGRILPVKPAPSLFAYKYLSRSRLWNCGAVQIIDRGGSWAGWSGLRSTDGDHQTAAWPSACASPARVHYFRQRSLQIAVASCGG